MGLGIERGCVGTTDTWKGNTVVDGSLVVSGNATVGGIINYGQVVGGYSRKEIDVPATTWTTGTNNAEVIDTGWDIPIGAIVKACYLVVGTIDAGETINVGTTGTNGTTCTEFLNAISIDTGKTGMQTGYPEFTAGSAGGNTDSYWKTGTCKVGTSLCYFIAGSDLAGQFGVFLPKATHYPTGASVFYSGSAGMDTAAFKIVIEYVV